MNAKNWTLALSTLLLVLALSACVTPDTNEPIGTEQPVSTMPPDPAARTVVHDAFGRVLQPSAFGDELPVMEGRILEDLVGDHGSFEPTVGIGPDGTAYYVAGDAPLTRNLFRSSDHGKTWQEISPRAETDMSGDPWVHVDPDTGRILLYDQQAYLLCDNFAMSDDKGTTWTSWNTCQDASSFGDHPSIATGKPRVRETKGYPNLVYFCASIGGASSCRVSVDGGRNYGAPVAAIEQCEEADGTKGPSQTGHVWVDANGSVYLAKVACGVALLGISHDDAQTWRTVRIEDSGWSFQKWPELNEHEASVAVDEGGAIYVALSGDDGLPKLVVSRDDGATWSKPINISRPEITASNFVHLVAGDAGRIAVMYLGTTVQGGFNATASAMTEATWNAYVAFSINADSDSTLFATTTANEFSDPQRRGECWARCPVRRGPTNNGVLQDSMGDFLHIRTDPTTGYVWLALVDLCHEQCNTGTQVSPDQGAYARAYVGVQVGGVSMFEAR